jgi:flavin reductase (DIM6/NTAB) family NADH-FMN oxidoreductase RutF
MSIRNQSGMLALVTTIQRYSVSVLTSDQEYLSRHYGGCSQLSYEPCCWNTVDGIPRLDGALATFVCRMVSDVVVGDHTVIFGEVLWFGGTAAHCDPLVFYGGRYCQVRNSLLAA